MEHVFNMPIYLGHVSLGLVAYLNSFDVTGSSLGTPSFNKNINISKEMLHSCAFGDA